MFLHNVLAVDQLKFFIIKIIIKKKTLKVINATTIFGFEILSRGGGGGILDFWIFYILFCK